MPLEEMFAPTCATRTQRYHPLPTDVMDVDVTENPVPSAPLVDQTTVAYSQTAVLGIVDTITWQLCFCLNSKQ